MAIVNFVSGQIISFKDDGNVNAGGLVYFYVPGTSTAKDTYPTAADAEALTNANANPLVLNSAGRGTAFLNGDYKVIAKTSADVTIYTTDSINPTDTVTSTARSTAYTLLGTDNTGVTEASGTFTLTLTAAATLGSGWQHYVKNVGVGTVTIGRANAGNTINGTAANITLAAGQDAVLRVIAAETGFITDTGPAIGNTFTPVQYFTAGLGPSYIQNYSLTGAVAGNALTITMSGYDGTALSSTNKAQFTFVNTAVSSTSSVLTVTANKTLVISSGSTLGATNAVPFRVWILAVRDTSDIQIGAIVCSTSTNIYQLSEHLVITSTAEGGAGAADSAGVIYTTSALTDTYRILGFMEFTLTTAGTWNALPDRTRLYQSGGKLPGDVVQVARTATGALVTGTTLIPSDDTIPQNTEGDEHMTRSITPTSGFNYLRVQAQWFGANSAAGQTLTAALFRDTTAGALAVAFTAKASASYPTELNINHVVQAASVSATTLKIRAGSDTAGTTSFNGAAGVRRYGGVMASYLEVAELMA